MESDSRLGWEHATDSEVESLQANGTWEMTLRIDDMHLLHTKSVFKTNTNADGNVEWYKTRMRACGKEKAFVEECYGNENWNFILSSHWLQYGRSSTS